MPTDEYIVHTSLRDDMNEGWVWIRNLKSELNGKRCTVRITAKPGKSIFCEALYADEWYMKKWIERWNDTQKNVPPPDANLAFISAWYRGRLSIGEGPQNLTIDYKDTPRPFWWQLYVCLEHPQVVVLLATLLAIIGLGLGILALGLAIFGVPDWRPYGFWIGGFFMLLGAFVMLPGLLWGWRR
jgi:hypothetical protein